MKTSSGFCRCLNIGLFCRLGSRCTVYLCLSYIQISDIHLSIVNRLAVGKDLRSFCTDTVSTIAPSLVLVTGV